MFYILIFAYEILNAWIEGEFFDKIIKLNCHKHILEILSKWHKILVAKIEGEFLTNFQKTQIKIKINYKCL